MGIEIFGEAKKRLELQYGSTRPDGSDSFMGRTMSFLKERRILDPSLRLLRSIIDPSFREEYMKPASFLGKVSEGAKVAGSFYTMYFSVLPTGLLDEVVDCYRYTRCLAEVVREKTA